MAVISKPFVLCNFVKFVFVSNPGLDVIIYFLLPQFGKTCSAINKIQNIHFAIGEFEKY